MKDQFSSQVRWVRFDACFVLPLLLLALQSFLGSQGLSAGERAAPRKGLVATVNPVATEAGLQALRDGGNAVDAAIACALTLGVVDGHNSGLGGGCFMTLRLADGRLITLDGREMAPAAATRDLFLRGGKADPLLSQDGALSVGIPGEFATLAYASTNYGRLPLGRLLEAAARVVPVNNTKGQGTGDGRIDRIAPVTQGLQPRLGGHRIRGRDETFARRGGIGGSHRPVKPNDHQKPHQHRQKARSE